MKLLAAGVWEGLYFIVSVASLGRYTLCLEDRTPIKDGKEVGESDLVTV